MASIRDVAELADVSTATVSHVINGTRPVSSELTERVRQAMALLSYRPDAVARSLRRRETLTIGMLVPSIEIPFFASVVYSVERAASDYGYSVILCNSGWQQATEEAQLQDLLARRVDGLICISAQMGPAEIAPVVETGTPVVMFERQMPGVDLDSVGLDNAHGARLATRHLLDHGHRRIAIVCGPAISSVSTERIDGFRQTLTSAGLTLDPGLVFTGDYLSDSGRQALDYFLTLDEPPTAIFAFNDMMALGLLQALYERGLVAPDAMAVVGFDGISLSQYTSPSLTTVRQPLEVMGRAAVELLLARIRGEGPGEAQHVTLEPELIVRDSSIHNHQSVEFTHVSDH